MSGGSRRLSDELALAVEDGDVERDAGAFDHARRGAQRGVRDELAEREGGAARFLEHELGGVGGAREFDKWSGALASIRRAASHSRSTSPRFE